MASGGTRLAGLDLVLHFKQTTKPTGLARQPSDFLWLISKKVTKEMIALRWAYYIRMVPELWLSIVLKE